MFDIEEIKENEVVIIGVRSKDFLGNPILNEYAIRRTEKSYNVSFTKAGLRNERYSGMIEVDKLITNIIGRDRDTQLINFICENSELVAETTDKEFRMRLKDVIYYKVINEGNGENDGTKV